MEKQSFLQLASPEQLELYPNKDQAMSKFHNHQKDHEVD